MEKLESINDKTKEELLDSVIREIRTYPVYTGKMRMKDTLKRCMGKKIAPVDRFFWPHAMLSYGLLEAHKSTGSEKAYRALQEYADRYIAAGVPIRYADNVMNGEALLYLYRTEERTDKRDAYLRAAERLADYAMQYEGKLIYRPGNPTHIYVDALGMVCPVLAHLGSLAGGDGGGKKAAEKTENIGYTRACAGFLKDFLEKGMDEKSGLPYHGYDAESGEKMGIIGWGRAVGWLLMALSGSLAYMEDTGEKEWLREQFEMLVLRTCVYQKEDGLFHWQLPATEGPSDTSATAMILYAVKQGVKNGSLREDHTEMMQRAEQGLCAHIRNGNVDQCLAECMGYAMYPQVYGTYPWGLGMSYASFMSILS